MKKKEKPINTYLLTVNVIIGNECYNITINNICVISRWSVLLVVENIVLTVGHWQMLLNKCGGLCGRECMVVGFTTTCAISAYHR